MCSDYLSGVHAHGVNRMCSDQISGVHPHGANRMCSSDHFSGVQSTHGVNSGELME